ncbi:MAG: trypsin-like peptidase domain-containing protein [Acholeplasmataceae bacterium]|jgi:S1-C subfamily serine protease|nr:trypsin-like peptidase domain-containing protein [Acholeplasmataceae bacterium]
MRRFEKIINWIIVALIVVILAFQLPYKEIKNATKRFFNTIHQLIENIADNTSFDRDSTSDKYVFNIDFEVSDEQYYYATIKFKTIDVQKITAIEINNVFFFDFKEVDSSAKTIVVDLNLIINPALTFEKISIGSIVTETTTFQSKFETTFFKAIDYQIINEKRQSIIGISAAKATFFPFVSDNSVWGSGIIFKKSEIIVNNSVVAYEYLILTNAHVVEKKDDFTIHYQKMNNKYPKRGRYESVELLGTYIYHTDLAILKLTTKDDSLVSLEDEQFITKTPVSIEVGQVVFSIGSPVIKNEIMFNQEKIGIIKELNRSVRLKDSDEICRDGCNAFQTSTFQGQGSSGGGVFDVNGNLIGIHFGGREETMISSEIPMEKILEAIEYILGVYEAKRSHVDFFFLSENFMMILA